MMSFSQKFALFSLVTFLTLGIGSSKTLKAQDLGYTRYDIGTPILTDIWVDPVLGNNSRSGATRDQAVRTVQEAWNRIPSGELSGTGYRILLTRGVYARADLPNYWESKRGTQAFPIILQGVDGQGAAVFQGDINAFDIRYMYLIGFSVIPVPAGDALHFEQSDHLLIRDMEVSGGERQAHETIKINQSQYVYVEDSEIYGSYENNVDFVAVQYGHFRGNKIHDADDWCIYLKGGSAYFVVEGNEIFNCGTGGFTAGQGSGFEYMTSPWLHYEAYDIKFINNIIHDTDGAGFGVNGGYNILLGYNTLYRVGSRSHAIEVVYGLRTCDESVSRCGANLSAGGWGTTELRSTEEPIPNKNIFIYNNILFNPPGFRSPYSHFAIQGPRTTGAGSNIPSPARTDTNLQIKGNIIWNGPSDLPLGIEDGDQGCQSSNPTCNSAQLRAENAINTIEPQLISPATGSFRPVIGGNVYSAAASTIPGFAGTDRVSPPLAPVGQLVNSIARDFAGSARTTVVPAGAFAGPVRERTSANGYLPWNSFLEMTNIVELVNSGSTDLTVVVTVFDNSGNAVSQISALVPARGQRDVILNALVGFPRNSYGLVTLDYSSSNLSSRISYYRQRSSAESSDEFDIAYSIPGAEPLTGQSYLGFNTFQPSRRASDSVSPVNNWLSIVNLDPSSSHTYSVRRFNQLGELLSTRTITIAAFARFDIEGGHESPGPGNVGLNEIVPDSALAPYYAFNTRFGVSSLGDSFNFAFPLFGKVPGPREQYINVSTGGDATNWLELINTSDSRVEITIRVFGGSGEELGQQTVSLAARAQVHLYINAVLGIQRTGLVQILSNREAAVIAQSMYYYYRNDSSISAMYGVQTGSVISGAAVGSYNLFLEMNNWIKISNASALPQAITVRVFDTRGQERRESIQLPPHATTELGFHETSRWGTSNNTYGQFIVEGNSLAVELLRVRSADSGFDFVFPTEVR